MNSPWVKSSILLLVAGAVLGDFGTIRENNTFQFLLREQRCEGKMKVSERLGTVSKAAAAAEGEQEAALQRKKGLKGLVKFAPTLASG